MLRQHTWSSNFRLQVSFGIGSVYDRYRMEVRAIMGLYSGVVLSTELSLHVCEVVCISMSDAVAPLP